MIYCSCLDSCNAAACSCYNFAIPFQNLGFRRGEGECEWLLWVLLVVLWEVCAGYTVVVGVSVGFDCNLGVFMRV